MSVKNSEEALAADAGEGHDDGVCILHGATRAFGVGDGDLEGECVGEGSVAIDGDADVPFGPRKEHEVSVRVKGAAAARRERE